MAKSVNPDGGPGVDPVLVVLQISVFSTLSLSLNDQLVYPQQFGGIVSFHEIKSRS